jgi:hypothetical protein
MNSIPRFPGYLLALLVVAALAAGLPAASTAQTCSLGNPDLGATGEFPFATLDNYFLVYFDPASCGCASGCQHLLSAHVLVDAAEGAVMDVSAGFAAFFPPCANPPSPPLYLSTVTVGPLSAGIQELTVPLPDFGCQETANFSNQFLAIGFHLAQPGPGNFVLQSTTPSGCPSYHNTVSTQLPFAMWVDFECCQCSTTSADGSSPDNTTFGRVKTMYR